MSVEHELEDFVDSKGEMRDANFDTIQKDEAQVGIDGLPIHPVEDLPVSQHKGPIDASQQATERVDEEEFNVTQKMPSEEEETTETQKYVKTIPAIFNLLNSVLGIGLLSVPNSFINTGFVLSYIILLIMAILSYFATAIVIQLQKETNAPGFDELALQLLGKVGSVSLSVLSLFFLACGLLSYLIVAGDMLLSWFSLAGLNWNSLLPRAAVIGVYALCLPILMTIPRNIKFLEYFSTATIICLTFYTICMIYKFFATIPSNGINESCDIVKAGMGIFSSLSIYGLTFSLPSVSIPVIKNCEPNLTKRKLTGLYAIIACFVIVAITGFAGYSIFGSTANANILNSFPNDDVIIIIVRIGFFIVVTCAYPLLSQTVFGNWSQLIYKVNDANQLPNGKRAVILLIGNGIPLIIAMFLSSIKPVISVSGSLGGCIVNFMFPGVLYVKHSPEKWTSWKNILAIALAIFGLVAGVISTYQAIVDAIAAFK